MQHGTSGVLALKLVLMLQGLKWIFSESNWELRAVCVVRRLGRACLQYPGETLAVFPRKTVGSAFGRRRLEVVQVPGLLLELTMRART